MIRSCIAWLRRHAVRLALVMGVLAIGISIWGWSHPWWAALFLSLVTLMRSDSAFENLPEHEGKKMRKIGEIIFCIFAVTLFSGVSLLLEDVTRIIPLHFFHVMWVGMVFILICIYLRQKELLATALPRTPEHDLENEE